MAAWWQLAAGARTSHLRKEPLEREARVVERLAPAAQKKSRQFVWCNRELELEGLRACQFARCDAQPERW